MVDASNDVRRAKKPLLLGKTVKAEVAQNRVATTKKKVFVILMLVLLDCLQKLLFSEDENAMYNV